MNASCRVLRPLRARLLGIAMVCGLCPMMASAQDHAHMHMPMPMPMPEQKAPVKQKPAVQQPVRKKPAVTKPRKKAAPVHPKPPTNQPPSPMAMPPGEAMPGMDHAARDHSGTAMPMDESRPGMDHGAMISPGYEPRVPVPTPTDADRAAAFPEAADHTVHDNAVHSYLLLNRLEAWSADEGTGTGIEWEGQGWIGTDLNKVWIRSEGERVDNRLAAGDLEVLYGRSIARWWDLVVGVRHDFKPGASGDFAAFGVMGLAPQKFEVAATAYVGSGGQTALRVEAERELLLTNRLILQPLIEANAFGKDDARRGIGAGLSTIEAGLRLRYEVTRKFAPYIGVVHERAYGQTADYRRADGHDIDDTRVVAGVRIWF